MPSPHPYEAAYYDADRAQKTRRKRGVLLGGFLLFDALANMGIAGGSVYTAVVASSDAIELLDPDNLRRTQQLAVIAAGAAFLNLVAILGIWTFRRWGIALSLAVSLVGAGLAWRLGYTANLVANGVSILLLLLLTLPRLTHFD